MNVAGKVAVVTGGAGGNGAALAGRLAGAGAHGDVSRTDVLGEICALAKSRFGPVDLFLASAGVSGEPGIGDSDEDWQQATSSSSHTCAPPARSCPAGWPAVPATS